MINYNLWQRYLKTQVENRSIYLWGGQGEGKDELTDRFIRKRETNLVNALRVMAVRDRRIKEGYNDFRAYDCSGLGVAELLRTGEIKHDMSAEALREQCTMIQREELKPGDFVFRMSNGRAVHIGYVVDSLNVIHAKGREPGVVLETLNRNGRNFWDAYGRSPFIEEANVPGYESFVFMEELSRKECEGEYREDVKALQ